MGTITFLFYNSWLSNKECCEIIRQTLSEDSSSGWTGFVIHSKIWNLKPVLKNWLHSQESQQKLVEQNLLVLVEIKTLIIKLKWMFFLLKSYKFFIWPKVNLWSLFY